MRTLLLSSPEISKAEEQSHPPSMNELAGLLYWGHRGFAREQERALRLWNGVAVIGEGHDDNRMNGEEEVLQEVVVNRRRRVGAMLNTCTHGMLVCCECWCVRW